MKAFNWTLREIDKTDIESLMPFMAELVGPVQARNTIYCDQVDWL